MNAKHCLLLSLTCLLYSCAPRTAKPVAHIQRTVDWPVLKIAPLLPNQIGMHHIELHKNERSFRFDAMVEMEANHQVMVGMTPVGTVGFTLKSDAQKIEFERIPFYKLPIRPEIILTAYHWTFLEVTTLEPFLRSQGLSLEEPDKKTRLIRLADETIATIHYESNNKFQGTATYQQPKQKIRIRFLTRSLETYTP